MLRLHRQNAKQLQLLQRHAQRSIRNVLNTHKKQLSNEIVNTPTGRFTGQVISVLAQKVKIALQS